MISQVFKLELQHVCIRKNRLKQMLECVTNRSTKRGKHNSCCHAPFCQKLLLHCPI